MLPEECKPLQIKNQTLIHDDDHKINSFSEYYELLLKLFDKHDVKSGKEFYGKNTEFKNQFIIDGSIALKMYNCIWLNYDKGHDDYRTSKRRIELGSDSKRYANYNELNGIKTYYIGVYSYGSQGDYLYVIFNPEDYSSLNPHNSAAHVSIFDLFEASIVGYYHKRDKGNHNINVVNQKYFIDFILNNTNSIILKKESSENALIEYFKNFWSSLPAKCDGITSYKLMREADYSKQFETRWEGFIYEYYFETYFNATPNPLIEIFGDKKTNGIDLDLKFNTEPNFYGDLKNDNTDSDILGNDKKTMDEVIESGGHIWYICSRFKKVVMDSEKDYAVKKTYIRLKEEYNQSHKTKKAIKYDKYNDLKFSYEIDKYFIIDINKHNITFLKAYQEGMKNSNGKPRKGKYRIAKKTFEDFIKFEYCPT